MIEPLNRPDHPSPRDQLGARDRLDRPEGVDRGEALERREGLDRPGEPGQPGELDRPGELGQPGDPGRSVTPGRSGGPVPSATPARQPDALDEPNLLDEPNVLDEPNLLDEPNVLDGPNPLDGQGLLGGQGALDGPDSGDRPDPADRPTHPDCATQRRHVRPKDVRRANTAAALRMVLDVGPLPRADIAARLDLSQGTISRIVGPIVASGLLRELPSLMGGGGRPRVPVDLDSGARLVIGVHIGRQRTTAGLVDLRGGVRTVRIDERGPAGPAEVVSAAAELVRELRAEAGGVPVLGVGVATGGWVDPATGTVVDNEALSWRDVPLRTLLTDALNQPGGAEGDAGAADLPVLVDSAARAQATAEVCFGCAQDVACSVHLFTGNVIDAAIAMGRQVHSGVRSAAGAIGHLPVRSGGPACACGRGGVLQAVATDRSVLAGAVHAGLIGEDEGLPRLAELALSGDRTADALLRERARHIGTAVAHLVELLDPDLVVLSGGVLAVPAHLDEVRDAAARLVGHGWDAGRVRATALGPRVPHALVASSAALFLTTYFDDPLGFETFA